MERAMKLALVDPRHVEYRDLNKTPEGQKKADLSIEMRRILNDDSVPDDVKLKLYSKTLDRFLNVRDTVPEQTLPPININWAPNNEKKRKLKKTGIKPAVRKSTRKRKIPWIKF
jgi:hypothetical protein